MALTAASSYTQAFFKTLGEESAKSASRAIGRERRRNRRLVLTLPGGLPFLILIWPQGITDESVLALLDLDVPIEGGTFRWNPDIRIWEQDQLEG